MLRPSIFVEPHGASRALLYRLTDSQLVVLGGRNRRLVAHALLGSRRTSTSSIILTFR